MSNKLLTLTALLVLAAACDDNAGYCAGVVVEDDLLEEGPGSGFYDPEAVGYDICFASDAGPGKSECLAEDGRVFGDVDTYENGGTPFCKENGYTDECSSNLFVKPGDPCPGSSRRGR